MEVEWSPLFRVSPIHFDADADEVDPELALTALERLVRANSSGAAELGALPETSDPLVEHEYQTLKDPRAAYLFAGLGLVALITAAALGSVLMTAPPRVATADLGRG